MSLSIQTWLKAQFSKLPWKAIVNLHETVKGFQHGAGEAYDMKLSPSRLLYWDLVSHQLSATITSDLPIYSCGNPGGLRPGAHNCQLVT